LISECKNHVKYDLQTTNTIQYEFLIIIVTNV